MKKKEQHTRVIIVENICERQETVKGHREAVKRETDAKLRRLASPLVTRFFVTTHV